MTRRDSKTKWTDLEGPGQSCGANKGISNDIGILALGGFVLRFGAFALTSVLLMIHLPRATRRLLNYPVVSYRMNQFEKSSAALL